MILDETAVTRLGGAAALVLGTVSADGRPHGCRAWSATPDAVGETLRVVIDADDERLLANLRAGSRVALTSANVVTLASLQVKGSVRAVEEMTALDHATRERRTDLFLGDISETDRVPREILDALVPERFLVCVVEVDEIYDQTPGPKAGRVLSEGAA